MIISKDDHFNDRHAGSYLIVADVATLPRSRKSVFTDRGEFTPSKSHTRASIRKIMVSRMFGDEKIELQKD